MARRDPYRDDTHISLGDARDMHERVERQKKEAQIDIRAVFSDDLHRRTAERACRYMGHNPRECSIPIPGDT